MMQANYVILNNLMINLKKCIKDLRKTDKIFRKHEERKYSNKFKIKGSSTLTLVVFLFVWGFNGRVRWLKLRPSSIRNISKDTKAKRNHLILLK